MTTMRQFRNSRIRWSAEHQRRATDQSPATWNVPTHARSGRGSGFPGPPCRGRSSGCRYNTLAGGAVGDGLALELLDEVFCLAAGEVEEFGEMEDLAGVHALYRLRDQVSKALLALSGRECWYRERASQRQTAAPAFGASHLTMLTVLPTGVTMLQLMHADRHTRPTAYPTQLGRRAGADAHATARLALMAKPGTSSPARFSAPATRRACCRKARDGIQSSLRCGQAR